jgi:tetratricopeptide (TPR) repeat protein
MIQPADVLRELPEAGRSGHFVLHGRFDEAEANEILQTREKALEIAAAALGDPPEGFVVDLHVYADRETKEEKTGVPDPAHSFPSRRETHMVLTTARASGVREEVHLLSVALFGPTYSTALYDGLAVLVGLQNDPGRLPLYGAMLQQRGEMPTIDQLLDEEQLRKLIRQRVGMAASGLFVQWLLESGGEELLARAFAQTGLSRAHLGSWMGLAPDRLDPALHSWVSMLAGGAQAELEFQTAVEEARQLRGQGNPSAAADALLRALTHRPDHPETLYKLGLALIEAERFESAERYLGHLVGLAVDSSDSRYVVFGRYQLGLLCERLGRSQEAEQWLRRVLEAPDQFNSHQMALEALEAMENRIDGGSAGGETAEE